MERAATAALTALAAAVELMAFVMAKAVAMAAATTPAQVEVQWTRCSGRGAADKISATECVWFETQI